MREKADCQDLQTHLEEEKRDCCKKELVEESDVKVCVDGMKKK